MLDELGRIGQLSRVFRQIPRVFFCEERQELSFFVSMCAAKGNNVARYCAKIRLRTAGRMTRMLYVPIF